MPYKNKYKAASLIGKINWNYKGQNKHTFLIVLGRIGTSSPELAKEFMDESDEEGIVHVYDVSGRGCELYNDLEKERLVVRM